MLPSNGVCFCNWKNPHKPGFEPLTLWFSLQVRRLQHHPSVALWAGNNENEIALNGNWYDTDKNFTVYKDDYIKLYVDTIMDVVSKEDPQRPFIVRYFSRDTFYSCRVAKVQNKSEVGWPRAEKEKATKLYVNFGQINIAMAYLKTQWCICWTKPRAYFLACAQIA